MADVTSINLNRVKLQLADTNDPVAQAADWSPLRSGGSNFKTQDLVIAPGLAQVKNTAAFWFFTGIFAGVGLLALGLAIKFLIAQNWGAALFLGVFGVLFGAIAKYLLFGEKQLTFDKHIGCYYEGDTYIEDNSPPNREIQGPLAGIYAIQVISERVHSNTDSGASNYQSYEINLVFHDGYRLNVMDHGDANSIEQSAKALGQFLDKPVWLASY